MRAATAFSTAMYCSERIERLRLPILMLTSSAVRSVIGVPSGDTTEKLTEMRSAPRSAVTLLHPCRPATGLVAARASTSATGRERSEEEGMQKDTPDTVALRLGFQPADAISAASSASFSGGTVRRSRMT